MIKLKTLRARSVRGLPRSWPDLPIGDRGLVVYGGNGVGKSSLIDALEFAIKSETTIFAEKRQGVSWETGAPHVKDGDPDIDIEVQDGNIVSWMKDAAKQLPAATTKWIETARRSSFVLRRHMLLRFITEQPKDRYELLEPFFNLESYPAIENALRAWSEGLATQRLEVANKSVANANLLRQIFSIAAGESIALGALLTQLNANLAKANVVAAATLDDLTGIKKTIEKELGGTEQSKRFAELGNLKQQAQRLGLVSEISELINGLIEAVRGLERLLQVQADEVNFDLLVSGRHAIQAGSLDACPLCGQPIDRTVLLERLDAKIKANEAITGAKEVVKQRRAALQRATEALHAAVVAFETDWKGAIKQDLPAEYAGTVSLLSDLLGCTSGREVQGVELEKLAKRLDHAVKSHKPVMTQIDDLIVAEGGGERRILLQNAMAMINTFNKEVVYHSENVRRALALSSEKIIADWIYEHAIEARKVAVQDALNAVSKTANQYYDKIHLGENIGSSKLHVRQVGQGSVNLSASFAGSEEPPLLHFSESHLDTLGLCYFLALRKQEAARDPAFRLVVLDDVLHSVDSSHRGRVADLLKTDFADHQIVITTHDRHFYALLRERLGSSGFHYQTISGWDLDRGPTLGNPLTDLDIVLDESKYASLRPEDLCSTGGRVFEWLLKALTENLKISIPARFMRRHDIGSMWPPLCSKLKTQQGYAAAHPSTATRLDQSKWVRNECGAHDNVSESPITHSEAVEFARSLASLYRDTRCTCGFINKQKSGDWRCECGDAAFSYAAKIKNNNS